MASVSDMMSYRKQTEPIYPFYCSLCLYTAINDVCFLYISCLFIISLYYEDIFHSSVYVCLFVVVYNISLSCVSTFILLTDSLLKTAKWILSI